MQIFYSSKFKKRFKKSPQKIQIAFSKRLKLFIEDPKDPILHEHQLIGELKGLYGINISGDWRAIFQVYDNEDVVFVLIGTHSQLYK